MNPKQPNKVIRWLIIVLVTLVGVALASCTAIPKELFPQFTYQGVLTDENGTPYNGPVTIIYKLYHDPFDPGAIFTQTRIVAVDDGRFTTIVGPDSLAEAAGLTPEALTTAIWLELTVGNGTYTETLTPRQRLYGAPYAFTLMPGTVISQTMGAAHATAGIEGIVTVYNTNTTVDALPALRGVGWKGLEVAGAPSADGSGTSGRIYGDMGHKDNDLILY